MTEASTPPVRSVTVAPPPSARGLIEKWLERAREAQWGHYGAERALLRRHYMIGLPLLALTTISGTSVFAMLSIRPIPALQIISGVMAVAAAILSALQTFLRSTENAMVHRQAATRYAGLRRELEQSLVGEFGERALSEENVSEIRAKLTALAEESPPIPQRIWNRTEARLRSRR